MKAFLYFHIMVTPIIIKLIFWVATVLSVVIGINNIIQGHYGYAIQIIILGPILFRIGAEVLLIFFQIHTTLKNIERQLNTR